MQKNCTSMLVVCICNNIASGFLWLCLRSYATLTCTATNMDIPYVCPLHLLQIHYFSFSCSCYTAAAALQLLHSGCSSCPSSCAAWRISSRCNAGQPLQHRGNQQTLFQKPTYTASWLHAGMRICMYLTRLCTQASQCYGVQSVRCCRGSRGGGENVVICWFLQQPQCAGQQPPQGRPSLLTHAGNSAKGEAAPQLAPRPASPRLVATSALLIDNGIRIAQVSNWNTCAKTCCAIGWDFHQLTWMTSSQRDCWRRCRT